MNSRLGDASRLGDVRAHGGEGADIEESAVKKVAREAWQSKLKEQGSNVDVLEKHAAFMNGLLGTVDYEAVCMPIIASHAKRMSRGELVSHINIIESLAVGYKSVFGARFAKLMIAGLAVVSKDLRSSRGHMETFVSYLARVSGAYERRMAAESGRIERLNGELARRRSGIFGFFRKGELQRIRESISEHSSAAARLGKRRGRYASVSERIRSNAELRQARK